MKAISKFYAIPLIFFIASVALIYYIKPESRERIQNITCQNITEVYFVVELVNRTPNYLVNERLSRTVGANSTTFIGKVNTTNLENIPVRFFINYTFHVTSGTGSKTDDKYYVNTSIAPKMFEEIRFYTIQGQGAEATSSYVITVANISLIENASKTNITQKCF